MKKIFAVIILLIAGLAPVAAQAQVPAKVDTASTTVAPPGIVLGDAVAPAVPAKPVVSAAAPGVVPAVALAPVTPAADPNALKVRAEVNPTTGALTVRTDAPGPMRVEINDVSGHPVITKNVMVGTSSVLLDVKRLPAGSYVVRCTAGEKTGIRRVLLGQ